MARCTVTCYSSSCMSTIPSITFYTFPPSSLPAHTPWSFFVYVTAGRPAWVFRKGSPRNRNAGEGPGSPGKVMNVSEGQPPGP